MEETLERIYQKYREEEGNIVNILHELQEHFGYIPERALNWFSKKLNIPSSRIFSVITFYPHFNLKPKGNLSYELPDSEFTFVLSTGRQLFQYHTGTMTRRVDAIDRISPCAYAEIHPGDAESMGIHDGNTVQVSSRRGAIHVKALISDRLSKGVVFIPFHCKETAANFLTNGLIAPVFRIAVKVCAVRVNPVIEQELCESKKEGVS
jgi:predicted molibdopterin-dependent oxidoreductase YjgC